ncbi:MAG: trypsin-like peptidase domain-containing protein [Candidatus Cloacimonetes bacterium]|nr:trypsin-like peptidase domain-containing protein [Candidatus Cloacimonadota bacterium]
MNKKKLLLIIILTVSLNTSILYLYDKYHRNKTNLHDSENSQLFYSLYRSNENQKISVSRDNAITDAISLITPAVVSVNVWRTEEIRLRQNHNIWIPDFEGVPLTQEVQSIGSGVLFTRDGYIITNAHVVNNASQIKVVMSDSTEHDTSLIGVDSLHDIAILKIDGIFSRYAILGTSSDLKIGEWTIAIGNAYAFLLKDSQPTVSVGVISALERDFIDLQDSRIYTGMIQTDATINPGNSGGPLVNIFGEVIGINTLGETGESLGIGFAIPIDRVKRIADELIQYGRIREVYFGFRIQEITPFIANYLRLNSSDGVIISNIDLNGPAHNAGLRRGDIITMINDFNIRNVYDTEIRMTDTSPGDTVSIKVFRDGREFDITLIAEEENRQ